MTPEQVHKTLVLAFKGIGVKGRMNLAYHERNRTPIYCGPDARLDLISQEGYG